MATTLVYVKKPILNTGTSEVFQPGTILQIDTTYWNTIRPQIEGKGFAEDLFEISADHSLIAPWPQSPDDLTGR